MRPILIRGGRVLDPSRGTDEVADLYLADGKVQASGRDLGSPDDALVLDAAGKVVSPGLIDLHVHLREPGQEDLETVATGAMAAAAGGFSAVCAMPNTDPVTDNQAAVGFIVSQAQRAGKARVYPIGAISLGQKGQQLAEFGELVGAGAVAVSDDGKPVVSSHLMRTALEYARTFAIPVADHCEDPTLSAGGAMHEGLVSTRLGLKGIPAAAEEIMVARDILLAESTGARFHVAHISSRHSLNMVKFAKQQGLPVTCEATPHHFALADADITAYDSSYKMKPPLRSECDVAAVIEGIVSGAVDAIATDHAPHPGSEKMQEFEKCPFGIIGLETALGLSLEKLYHTGKITLKRLVELFTTGPAGILGLERGRLTAGAPGDITIFDTESAWTYDVNRSFSKSKNSPFHGRDFRGGPVATIVAGAVVWQRGSTGM